MKLDYNKEFKIKFVSIRPGFVRTAMKGNTDATPNISKNAINKINKNNKAALLRSFALSKKNIFLKVCIKILCMLYRFL